MNEIDAIMHLRAARARQGLTDGKELLIHLLVEPWVFLDESLMELSCSRAKRRTISDMIPLGDWLLFIGRCVTYDLEVHRWSAEAGEA